MDAERWQRLETIWHAALQRGVDERQAFIRDACGSDAGLLREVESLLEQLHEDPEFLEMPLVQLSTVAPDDPEGAASQPTYIGPYRVVRPLGHGGMGDVFLAVQEAAGLDQSVAVKVIRRGMDSDEVLGRFHQERRILANLHHPNIAHLLDGGATDDGRPYFVMEYVEGEPIDAYCDRHRLSVGDRLKLFAVVCSAVQHAHNNLVVHRDLKPSNLLVTSEGVPKLLDFGIGKVLDPAGGPESGPQTRSRMRVLTPEYASPEQVRGERITTATDVHGLGVLLYKLLTAHHPYVRTGRSIEDVERAVCDEEPTRPSRIADRPSDRRLLSGDLDTIVLKALHKDPARRYASASALAEDLQRHLDGRPVTARPDTLTYRVGKFVRRNPWGVTAAGIALVALVSMSAVTYFHSRQVERERDAALEVRAFLLESFGARGADRDAPVAARELLDQQAATLGFAYAERPGLQAEMLQVVAEGYERLGLYQEAEKRARDALALKRSLPSAEPADVAWALEVLGWIRLRQGARAEADTLLHDAVARFRHAGVSGRRGLARALNDLGVLLQEGGDLDGAEVALNEALELRTRYFPHETRAIGVTASNLAALRHRRGNYREAVAIAERALDALRRAVGPDHQRSIIAQTNLTTMRMALGDWPAAERDLRDLLERQARIQGRTHPVTARVMVSLATALVTQGKAREAEPLAFEALASQEKALGPSPGQVAITLRTLSQITSMLEKFDESVALSTRALAIQRAVYAPMHVEVAEGLAVLAQAQKRAGDLRAAERSQREALAVLDSALGRTHPRTARERWQLGETLNQLDRHAEAITVLREAHEVGSRAGGEATLQGARLEMARAWLRLGNRAAAESVLTAVERAFPPDSTQAYHRQMHAALRQELSRAR